jgi:hypothetical protein
VYGIEETGSARGVGIGTGTTGVVGNGGFESVSSVAGLILIVSSSVGSSLASSSVPNKTRAKSRLRRVLGEIFSSDDEAGILVLVLRTVGRSLILSTTAFNKALALENWSSVA